jgi:hypothetical protein
MLSEEFVLVSSFTKKSDFQFRVCFGLVVNIALVMNSEYQFQSIALIPSFLVAGSRSGSRFVDSEVIRNTELVNVK